MTVSAATAAGVLADLASRGSEQGVLEAVVAGAQQLAGARYAAALLLGPDGNPSGLAHTGMSPADVAALPHLPRPVGLIGHVLTGQRLRLAQMGDHPDAVGFPSSHVPMAAMLGVPVTVAGRVLGGLYLTRSPDQPPFGDDDEAAAVALATQTGTTVAALRSAAAARNLVDALGPTRDREGDQAPDDGGPSPVIRRMLATARSVLGLDLVFLARIEAGRQTFLAVDAGPGAPALPEGTVIDPAAGYCSRMLDGTIAPAVPDLRAQPALAAMPVTDALGVGAYCGVPVTLPDGGLYGTVCGLHSGATTVSSEQMQALGTIAALIGDRLATEATQAGARDRRRAAFTDLLTGRRSRIVLQPIHDLATDRTAGYEALSRFTDTTGAPWRPDLVFAEAGTLGIGVPVELAAARAALAHVPDLPADTYLSVNLSPAAVCDPATFDLLTGTDLHRVVVELTEHDRVEDYPAVVHALGGLRARGLRLAIDDTGSGFAGLQHLIELEPDVVKLDVAFVRGIDRDPARRAVARAVTGLAAELGASLVAEGIETPAELTQLRALGATHGQGYLLARPAPPGTLLPHRPVARSA